MTANTRLHGPALLEKFGLAWNQQRITIDGNTHMFQALRSIRRRKPLTTSGPKVGPKFGTRNAQGSLELNSPFIANDGAVKPFRDLRLRNSKAPRESNLSAARLDGALDRSDAGALQGSAVHGAEFITANDITSITDNDKQKAHNSRMKKKAVYAGFYERLCEAAVPLLGEGFSQGQLGEMFGVRQATVSATWAKDRLPEMDRLAEMAATLNVCLEWLVLGRGPRHPESDDPQLHALLELYAGADEKFREQTLILLKLYKNDELFRELAKHWHTLKDDLNARMYVVQAAKLHADKVPAPTAPAPATPAPTGKRRPERA